MLTKEEAALLVLPPRMETSIQLEMVMEKVRSLLDLAQGAVAYHYGIVPPSPPTSMDRQGWLARAREGYRVVVSINPFGTGPHGYRAKAMMLHQGYELDQGELRAEYEAGDVCSVGALDFRAQGERGRTWDLARDPAR